MRVLIVDEVALGSIKRSGQDWCESYCRALEHARPSLYPELESKAASPGYLGGLIPGV